MAEQQNTNDNELNELLDNALQDFVKNDKSKSDDAKASVTSGATAQDFDPANDSQDYLLEQVKLFAENMKTIFSGSDAPIQDVPNNLRDPEQILAGYKELAEAAAITLQGQNKPADEEAAKYSESLMQALKNLREGTDNLTAPVSEDDISQMFSSLNLENAGGEFGKAFLPLMDGVLQTLLSAEILLPSIKSLLEKYPKYLEENSDKISPEDKERYEKQFELYKIIEGHLTSEKPSDSAEEKREKFKVVLENMRKLQDYGQLPEQILAETGEGILNFDPTAEEGAAAGDPQCPIM